MLNIDEMNIVFESDEEIEAYASAKEINKIRIGHEGFMNAMEGIRNCMKSSVHEREPMNCMLLGDGGMGKTSLANVLMKIIKPETVIENDFEIQTVPAFYTSFKSSRTLDALTTNILTKLNDPHPNSGKTSDKSARVLQLLKKCRTKIMFVDELHDLDGFEERDMRNMRKMKAFFKWLKEISNECGPMICLMGVRHCYDIFDGDPEMARRFKKKYFLDQLTPGTRSNPGQIQGFLADVRNEIVNRTSVKSIPCMDDYLMSLRVFCATSGNPDFIMTLFKDAVRSALLNGRTAIDINDFSKVWESGTLNASSVIKINPFLASENQIASALRKTI